MAKTETDLQHDVANKRSREDTACGGKPRMTTLQSGPNNDQKELSDDSFRQLQTRIRYLMAKGYAIKTREKENGEERVATECVRLYIGFNIGEEILIKVLKTLHAANLIDRRVSAHPFAPDEYEIVWLSNALTPE